MLPPRLARLHVPVTAAAPCGQGHTSADPGRGSPVARRRPSRCPPRKRTRRAMLGSGAARRPRPGQASGIEVADAADRPGALLGQRGHDRHPRVHHQGGDGGGRARGARAQTRGSRTAVRQAGGTIVLVGGGDPTLAVNEYPSSDYPRPATLAQLAAGTARALKAQGRRSVRLGYDTSLLQRAGHGAGMDRRRRLHGKCHTDRRARGRPGTADDRAARSRTTTTRSTSGRGRPTRRA